MTRIVLLTLLAIHTLVTFISLKEGSVWAVFPPFREDFVYQIFSDLVSALGIVFLLIYLRLKEKGRSLKRLFFAIAFTVPLGSFSPLIYLLVERDLFDATPR